MVFVDSRVDEARKLGAGAVKRANIADRAIGSLQHGTLDLQRAVGTLTDVDVGTILGGFGSFGTHAGGRYRGGRGTFDEHFGSLFRGAVGSFGTVQHDLLRGQRNQFIGPNGTVTGRLRDPGTFSQVVEGQGTAFARDIRTGNIPVMGSITVPNAAGKLRTGTLAQARHQILGSVPGTVSIPRKTEGSLDIGARSSGSLDLATRSRGSLNLPTRTRGSLDLGQRSSGSLDLSTRSRGSLDAPQINRGAGLVDDGGALAVDLGGPDVGQGSIVSQAVGQSELATGVAGAGLTGGGGNPLDVDLGGPDVGQGSIVSQAVGQSELATGVAGAGLTGGGGNPLDVNLGGNAIGPGSLENIDVQGDTFGTLNPNRISVRERRSWSSGPWSVDDSHIGGFFPPQAHMGTSSGEGEVPLSGTSAAAHAFPRRGSVNLWGFTTPKFDVVGTVRFRLVVAGQERGGTLQVSTSQANEFVTREGTVVVPAGTPWAYRLVGTSPNVNLERAFFGCEMV